MVKVFVSHHHRTVIFLHTYPNMLLVGKKTPSQRRWDVNNTNGPCSAASILPPQRTGVVKSAERLRTKHPNLSY